jgi:hypothetical protein
MSETRKGRIAEFDPALVRDISEAVYRDRLGPDGLKNMVEADGDGGAKLRERSGSYDSLTRCYMRAIYARAALRSTEDKS